MREKGPFLAMACMAVALATAGCSDDAPPAAAAGGAGGGGGAGGTGGTGACVTLADDIIAQFKTDNGIDPVDGRSGGFYVYGDALGMFDPPKVGDAAYPIDAMNGNTTGGCSGPGSFRVKATGFKVWGAAAGVDFVPKVGTVKGTYNATKYRGVTFWAKAAVALTRVQVSFPDVYTDGAANPTPLDPTTSPCVYTAGALNNCSPYLVKFGDMDPIFSKYASAKIDTSWKKFEILFADTKQDPFNGGFMRAANTLDVEHLTGMAIQVNAISNPDMTVTANDFELWIDDVAFIK